MTDRINNIAKKFASRDTKQLADAVEEIKELSDFSPDEKKELASLISTIFYRDYTGNEPLKQVVMEAERLMVSFGKEGAEVAMEQLADADPDPARHFARILGYIGGQSVDLVLGGLKQYKDDQYVLTSMLRAAGCFTGADALKVLSGVFEYAASSNMQVKSAALYCFGRISNRLDSSAIDEKERAKMFDTSFAALADPKPLPRLHAIRAIGKMLSNSYLTEKQVAKSHKAFRAALGLDDYEWDNAYVVRNEAEHFLHLCKSGEKKGDKPEASRYHQDFRILTKKELSPNTYHFRINAPLLAAKIKAGQFVIIRPNGHSERIPLSICGWDREKGFIELIIMAAGRTSTEAVLKEVGDSYVDMVGPLGQRSHVAKYDGTCVVIGGGYGTGAIIPTARDLREMGNRVIGIVGAREKNLLIMVDELREACDEVYVTTNDGSEGIEGFVTHALEKIVENEKVSTTLAVGPVPMMIAVSNMTKEKGIECWVSLNAIMVDGTGMCGACRVSVGGKTKFACFHGPDFNGHEVNFGELIKRQKMFLDKEKIAMEAMKL